MNMNVESTNRTPVDYFHFGVAFWGTIIGIAGIVTTSIATAILGLALVAFALAYFALNLHGD